jgi:hypothetical protein
MCSDLAARDEVMMARELPRPGGRVVGIVRMWLIDPSVQKVCCGKRKTMSWELSATRKLEGSVVNFQVARDPGTIRRIDVSKSSYLPLISPAEVGSR